MAEEEIAATFQKSLNSHGFGFHYAVLKKIQGLNTPCHWRVEAAEYGVTVQGKDTRIDLLVRKGSDPFYLVGECKRANPAVSNWCFIKSSWYERRDSGTYAEKICRRENGKCVTEMVHLLHSDRAFQVPMDIRTHQKGESTTQGRGAIEDALGQACRGANGFAEFCQANVKFLEQGRSVSVLPVIFTTAKLYGSKTDVGSADVVSGELLESLHLEEYKWLWCDYPQSPGIKHTIPALGPTDRLDDYFRNVFLRRVAIVSANGISDFLNSQLWE